jgi:HEAT repeat protein
MNHRTNLPRTIISIAFMATGILLFFAQNYSPSSITVYGEEMSAVAQAAQVVASGMPNFENAKVESHALSGSLSDEIPRWAKSATEPQWLGYAVPVIDGERAICCNNDWNGNSGCGTCRLEDGEHGINFNSTKSTQTELEGPRYVVVLYRANGGAVQKLRVVSEICNVDAGGLRVTWLSGVDPAKSVEYLSTFVRGKELRDHNPERLTQGALTAIAMHGGPSADNAINSFVAADQPESLRKQAVFWLGAARGASGFQALKQLAKSDPESEVRAQVTFALSISHEAAAVDEMIRMAREDESTHVRGQALFWLAQKAGKKAESAITGAIDNDPDTEVKKKAVFALSQMPKDEGVPKLIQVAETNKNHEVRKQAMFWLGQSNDPRALAFFEKILISK